MVSLTRIGSILPAVAMVFLSCSVSARQEIPPIKYQPEPDSPIGERNAAAPAGLAQFDFVIGDWDTSITWQAPGQAPLTYNAKWHNHWVVDGQVVMQEWRGPFLTGAELRAFNPETGTWTGQNVYPGNPVPWHKTTAEFKDGKMVVVIEGNSNQRGPFLNRETYFDIAPDSFRMKSDVSYDGGKTWEKGSYEMVCRRVAGEG